MPSIHRRLLLGTALIVAIVVLLTGTAVNYSVFKRAEASLQDRLQGLIYGLLGATNVNSDNSVVVNEAELPDPPLLALDVARAHAAKSLTFTDWRMAIYSPSR